LSHIWRGKKEGNDDTRSWAHPFIEENEKEKRREYIYKRNREYRKYLLLVVITFENILIFFRTIKAYVDTYRHRRYNIECFQ
jgi:hypothetical protein